MTFSVITVCYNAANEIKKTIESVYLQTNTDYEYIFIDGKSSDHTLDIIHSFSDQFKKKGIQYTVISEPDSGIFNAMNKGVRVANGEWIVFMNAGDEFYDSRVLETVEKKASDGADIMYGHVLYQVYGLKKIVKSENLKLLEKRMPFCHQSSFVRRKKLIERPFDEKYLISADYDFFLDCYLTKAKFIPVDVVVARYEMSGVSSDRIKLRLYYSDIQYKYGLINCIECFFIKTYQMIKMMLRSIIVAFCGWDIIISRAKKRYIKEGYIPSNDEEL